MVRYESVERRRFGGVRICQWCYKAKPDRCHHCSQCNRCILKMDHHCPWVANCIGFYNHKFFMNMLLHCSITANLIAFTSYPVIKRTVTHPTSFDYKVSFFIMTAYIWACVVAAGITLFFLFHIYLISCGYTTIEYCEKRREEDNTFHARMPYNRGFVLNMCAVLGYNPFLWFVPFCKCSPCCLRPPALGHPALCLLTACVLVLSVDSPQLRGRWNHFQTQQRIQQESRPALSSKPLRAQQLMSSWREWSADARQSTDLSIPLSLLKA